MGTSKAQRVTIDTPPLVVPSQFDPERRRFMDATAPALLKVEALRHNREGPIVAYANTVIAAIC